MTVTDLEGRVLTVESQRDTGWTAPVYNIEVHEHHTYHVGGLGVWVHNANCCSVSTNDSNSKRTYRVDADNAGKGTDGYEVLNNPPSNAHVKISNGTEFVTNGAGMVEEVTFQPVLEKGTRDSRQTAVGYEGYTTDVGGHVQACRLGGTCDRYNLFPQDRTFNNSGYKTLENEWYSSLSKGDTVGPINIKFLRDDPMSPRPDYLVVEYSINGKNFSRFFANEAPK
ncbi:hypothetical protein CS062_00450 [Roseateles chitinivorans]|uniref:Type VII secretion system protein EssD-like domain-containing protein n=2 Tax=Roseateles chitinivorans TaxID=2917965 RepID=A0A2G9CFT3_9BURK|nr:hypothetical protein CS062_00450 [Roseateles chitinivorans]